MASKQGTVDFIIEQMAEAGAVSAKKMFGEYGLYLSGKLFGLVCDDRLFIKPTLNGRAFLGDSVTKAAPYPGAKPCFLIPGEAWEEGERLSKLARMTADQLPLAKKKPFRR